MKRSVARLCLPLVATVALLAGTVGTADAGVSTPGSPWAGACYWQLSWNSGTPGQVTYMLNPGHPNGGPVCYWYGSALCGVYLQPQTYHWVVSTWQWSTGADQMFYSTPCTGQIILNSAVAIASSGGYRDCWNSNANNWSWNRADVPC